MTYTPEQLEQMSTEELKDIFLDNIKKQGKEILTSKQSENIDAFLSWVEKTTFPPVIDTAIEILLKIAKLFRGLHKESRQDVERLQKEKRMLLDACAERFARICILTEKNERLKKEKEKLQMEIDWLTFGEKIAYELCDEQKEQIRMLTEEKERLKSQLDDALKTYESIIECATTTLYYFNGPNRRGGLIEIKKCAKEAIQRIKGEQEHEQK